jgi:manganese-dependent ADP-ribose/CDP-alcohol diphosphatase
MIATAPTSTSRLSIIYDHPTPISVCVPPKENGNRWSYRVSSDPVMWFAKLCVIILTAALVILYMCRPAAPTDKPQLVFGVIADVQYADLDTQGARYYRTAMQKLKECVMDLADRDLAFVIQLGDIVNGHGQDVNKSTADLDRILSVFNKLPMTKYHVLGNHCLSVDKEILGRKLGLERFYYDFTVSSVKGWRFVVLDGNDAGYGMVGDEQLAWFRSTIRKAAEDREKVICMSHFALLPEAAAHHRMATPEPILEAMDEAGCVVAWLAGHDHAGGYAVRKGVHHVTVRGMVESPLKNAYAVMELHGDKIVETGFGDEPSREMPFEMR